METSEPAFFWAAMIPNSCLPDGKTVLYTGYTGSQPTIFVRSLELEDRRPLFPGQTARYLSTGYLVYILDGDLYAVGFDLESHEVTGEAVPIAQDVFTFGTSHYAVSDSGLLAYLKGEEVFGNASLVWVDRSGNEETIDVPIRSYGFARLSPDGTRVALDIWDQENGRHDIWIWKFAGKRFSHFSLNPGSNMNPVWTPDGTKLAFMNTTGEGNNNIYWQSVDSSGSPELLIDGLGEPNLSMAFSQDMTKLLTVENALPNQINILELGDSTTPKGLFSSTSSETNPQISPNGRWLSYQSNESGKDEIYVSPFPNVNDGRLQQVSTEGGTQPLWNPNGGELFYYSPNGTMMVVSVKTDPSFEWETPKELFKSQYPSAGLDAGHRYSYDPDGQRFLMINDITAIGGATPQINIVVNWFEELKQKVPVD